jgi:hypothetical protein
VPEVAAQVEPEEPAAPPPPPIPVVAAAPHPQPSLDAADRAAVPPPPADERPVEERAGPVEVPAVADEPGGSEAREWNLWDLERLVQERVGEDPVRDEERSVLLLYLREYAGPDGVLPADFDPLVRDSFAELVGEAP